MRIFAVSIDMFDIGTYIKIDTDIKSFRLEKVGHRYHYYILQIPFVYMHVCVPTSHKG